MPQSIFVPTGPIPGNINFSQDRGAILFDPVTKSSLTKPVTYDETNACGDLAYKVGTVAVTINELINCVPTLAGTASLKVTIPQAATLADYNNLVGYLVNRLGVAFAFT